MLWKTLKINNMEKNEIKQIVADVMSESLLPVFAKMLEESEKRIDKTNEMVGRLADVVKKIDEHLIWLEKSKDSIALNNTELIKANIKLTEAYGDIRADYKNIISDFKTELLSAKEQYRRISEAYMRIAEKDDKGGSRADVKINV